MSGGWVGKSGAPGGGVVQSGVFSLDEMNEAKLRNAWSDDLYGANRVVILHFDGADASTTFTDAKGHTFTASGNAQIDTAQSLFGGASGLFDGSGDYISTPDSADWDFGTDDFEIELAVRFNALPSNAAVSFLGTWTASNGWVIQFRNDAGLGNRIRFIDNGDYGDAFDFAWSPSTNVWYRIAISRAGTSVRTFIDGTQIGTTKTTSQSISNTNALWIGSINSGGPIQSFNGWIDELRITKGVAPHTANYMPDTTPFPDL